MLLLATEPSHNDNTSKTRELLQNECKILSLSQLYFYDLIKIVLRSVRKELLYTRADSRATRMQAASKCYKVVNAGIKLIPKGKTTGTIFP